MLKKLLYSPFMDIPFPSDQKIVLVGGCFDILHFGHIQFLEKAKQAGDFLIVALEPDDRIINEKKRMPTHTHNERAENLLSLRSVDMVVMLPLLHGFDDYKTLVHTIKPTVIAMTEGDPQRTNKQKQAESLGIECLTVTTQIGLFSSSAIYAQHIE